MSAILAVDDDPQVLAWLGGTLAHAGHEPACAKTGSEAVGINRRRVFELALVDQRMPGLDGIDTFQRLRHDRPSLAGLMITGYPLDGGDCDRALQAGFAGLLQKPLRERTLLPRIDALLGSAGRLNAEGQEPGESAEGAPGSSTGGFGHMVGTSEPMRLVFKRIAQAATLAAPVLIQGETGTGKELVARAIHHGSSRRAGPFIDVNCSAIPVPLFEAEMFGREAGAFTDARDSRPGCFERAHHGTLFLDEVGDLPREAQAKLLRILETGEVMRLGGHRPRQVDARVIAATNMELREAVRSGGFREDLYWRLSALRIDVPPVRDRAGDLPLLFRHALDRLSEELGRPRATLAPDAMALLLTHDWRGNVREIQHVLRHALLNLEADRCTVSPADLPPDVTGQALGLLREDFSLPPGVSLADGLARVRGRLEPPWIASSLAAHGGHHGRTAEALGLSRKALYEKMIRYRLEVRVVKDDGPDDAN
jgi:DNA-binding NtrC family response regulator